MQIVVSDTSPLRALACVGEVGLLGRMYSRVLVPPQVADELSVSVWGTGAFELRTYQFIHVQEPRNVSDVSRFRAEVDQGEAEAIALAIEIHAESILMDDRAGRILAARVGLTPIGVLAILARARANKWISPIAPMIAQLQREMSFRVSDDVVEAVLRAAGDFPTRM